MSLSNYGNAVELPVSADKQQQFDAGVGKIRDTMVKHGFAREAVDLLQFQLKQYTLEITPEQARSGAFHIHADGRPVYEVTLTAPGNMMQLATLDSNAPTLGNPGAQALYLAFEVGMNLMGRAKDVLKGFYGETDDNVAGGVSASLGACNFETTMRCEPWKYMSAMNDLVDYRLKMIVDASNAAAAEMKTGTENKTSVSKPLKFRP